MFVLGGFFAMMMRLELLTPEGDLLTSDTYNKFFTLHGVVMIFFFLIPVIPAVLGNFLLPIMLGAKDLAFPRINLLSWYLYMIAAVVGLVVIITGGVDTGWTFYTPFSTQYSNTHVFGTTFAGFIAGFSSILTGLNFIVTIHRMRAPGLTWYRLPLFVWAMYATSIVQLLATPVLAITLVDADDRADDRRRHLRSGARRRSGALPAHVLVLLAPGRLHHDSAGHGRGLRGRGGVHAQEDLRLQVRRLLLAGDRVPRLPGVGAPPVRRRHLASTRR